MDIILNFLPLKQGGGIQVGLDFLNQAKENGTEHKWYVVVTESTPFINYEYCDHVILLKIIPDNFISRLLFEYHQCKKLIKKVGARVVYTQFGPIWPASKVVNVAGCAYSNLLYPEINFWGKLPFFSQIKRKFYDYLRTQRMLSADYIIFETDDLKSRATQLFGLPDNRVFCVEPSVSSLVHHDVKHDETISKVNNIPKGFRILLLSGYSINKNFEILPGIAKSLLTKYKIDDFLFVLTLNEKNNRVINLFELIKKEGLRDYFHNIGPVAYEGCAHLYDACDAVILPALLESFSNNIAESWEMKKPLLISDMSWSRSICKDSAVYIKYNDPEHSAEQISEIMKNKILVNRAVENGTARLKDYPSSEERFIQYKTIIEKSIVALKNTN